MFVPFSWGLKRSVAAEFGALAAIYKKDYPLPYYYAVNSERKLVVWQIPQ
jgi:hypothetical protein